MGWVRVEDDFYDNRKLAAVGPLGAALWTAGLAWCNRNLTDGRISVSRARGLIDFSGLAFVNGSGEVVTADAVIDSLVKAGLWEIVDCEFLVHDYLQYQPSREKVLGAREKERERWSRRAKPPASDPHGLQTDSAVDSATESPPTPPASQPQPQEIEANASTSSPAVPSKRGKNRSPNYAQAEGILKGWYEDQDPRPVIPKNSWPTSVAVIARFLDNGHRPVPLAAALRGVPVISVNAVQFALGKFRSPVQAKPDGLAFMLNEIKEGHATHPEPSG